MGLSTEVDQERALPSTHCVCVYLCVCESSRERADLWTVVCGLTNLDHPGPHSQTRGLRSIIVHPRYNRAVVDYDISVLQLDAEVGQVRSCSSVIGRWW